MWSSIDIVGTMCELLKSRFARASGTLQDGLYMIYAARTLPTTSCKFCAIVKLGRDEEEEEEEEET